MITKVEFYNNENGIRIIIPMNFDIDTDSLNIDQRWLMLAESLGWQLRNRLMSYLHGRNFMIGILTF